MNADELQQRKKLVNTYSVKSKDEFIPYKERAKTPQNDYEERKRTNSIIEMQSATNLSATKFYKQQFA